MVEKDVRDALVGQWRLIARRIPTLDLDEPSRVRGWRNREVLAHLSLQPKLLARFLETATDSTPEVSLVSNLAGTSTLAAVIDEAARRATDEQLDFAARVETVIPMLQRADLGATVTTMQGPIGLRDYLITRCVEAVVHGGDFTDPIEPDDAAMQIACAAFREMMSQRHPELLDAVDALSPTTWLNLATGREPPPTLLEPCCPLMS